MTVAIYIGIIIVMRVVQTILNKKTAKMLPHSALGYLKYTVYYLGVAGAIAGVVLLVVCLRGATLKSLGPTILYASVSGVALGLSCVLGKYLLNLTTLALTSVFATAGLLVPSVASIFLFDEKMAWYQWIAIAVFAAGAYLMIGNSKKIYRKFTVKTLLLLLLYFGVSGLTMLMQKAFGMNVQDGNTSLFSAITFVSGGIVAALCLGVFYIIAALNKKRAANATQESKNIEEVRADEAETRKDEAEARADEAEKQEKNVHALPPRIYLYGAGLAAAVFLINQLATLSTPLISSVILFTVINGGATVISALVGAILFKEKVSVTGAIGLVLGVGALVLVQL